MRTSSLNPRRATTAIAALLALTATPIVAQDAATAPLDGPIIGTPTTVTAPDPAPVLVIPDVSTVEEPAAEPVAAPVTRTAAPEPQPRGAPAARTSTPAAAAASEPVAASARTTGEPLAATEAETEAALPPVVPIDEPTNIQPTPEQATDITAVLGLILVALLGLVVAVFAFAYLRRRRAAIVETEAGAVREPMPREPIARPVATVAEPAPMAEPIPVVDRAPLGTLRANGAAVPLPARMPESYEERSALLQRMIDAKPDRANPFTDRRARMRRARLILQSLGRKFDGAKPWIDLSDYPENWPELARKPQAPAAPAYTRELEPA
jgi:hypothetical protein